MNRPYQDDLAYIHDHGHSEVARSAAEFLLRELRRRGQTDGTVVDLGCGSGILAAALSRAGYEVLGVDLSAAMLALARRRAPRARFLQESFLSVTLPECVAVAAVGEVLNYRFDCANSRAGLRRVFRRVHRALCPGGLLLCDVVRPRPTMPAKQQRFRIGEDWVVLVTVTHDAMRRELAREITSFRRVGQRYRRSEERHECRLIPPEEFTADLKATGFGVRRLGGYGEHRFRPAVVGFLAEAR